MTRNLRSRIFWRNWRSIRRSIRRRCSWQRYQMQRSGIFHRISMRRWMRQILWRHRRQPYIPSIWSDSVNSMHLILMIWSTRWLSCLNIIRMYWNYIRTDFVILWWMSIRIQTTYSFWWWSSLLPNTETFVSLVMMTSQSTNSVVPILRIFWILKRNIRMRRSWSWNRIIVPVEIFWRLQMRWSSITKEERIKPSGQIREMARSLYLIRVRMNTWRRIVL